MLKGALGMTEDDISHLTGLGYSKSFDDAGEAWSRAGRTPASSCAPRPVEQVQEVAGGGRVDAAQVDLLLPEGPDRPRLQLPRRVKIYTRKGDDGTTGLWYGGRVGKADPRPEAYGSVDEAASALGLARAAAEPAPSCTTTSCGSRTSCSSPAPSWPPRPRPPSGSRRASQGHGRRWSSASKSDIDRYMDRVDLPPKFVIPGGTELSARLDVARSALRRRAERRVVDPRRWPTTPCSPTSTAPRTPCTRWRASPTRPSPSCSREGTDHDEGGRAPRHGEARAPRGDARPPADGRRAARTTAATDAGPNPQELLAASLASCTRDHDGDVRRAQGMGHRRRRGRGGLRARAARLAHQVRAWTCKLPKELPEEQREQLMTIVAKCPVHRTLEGEVMFDEKVELA